LLSGFIISSKELFMQIQSLSGAWQFQQAGQAGWLPGQVPGGVHTDLMAAGRIPDPFVADNEKKVTWVAETDWTYRRSFEVNAALLQEAVVDLVCDGLDTIAAVTVNGQPVGTAENMFRQYRWNVKALLKSGQNEIMVAFTAPVKYIRAKEDSRSLRGVSQGISGAPHVRKAPCQFGWDWGPQLPPIGIWKDIRLEAYSTARFEDIHLRQQHANGVVKVSAKAALQRLGGKPLKARLVVTAPGGEQSYQDEKVITTGEGLLEVKITQPQLWWPNGYGAQPLYQVKVMLLDDEKVVDAMVYRLGLRTIVLKRTKDEWGESFTFVVNEVPIFAKGANWIPADSFPTRLNEQNLGALIASTAATHQNMLRVWGGGLYESELFYDLCEQAGILVWQEGVFACSIYPLDDDEFLANVRQEVLENVRRLRHRTSLCLWCGNNEMEWGWESWGWNKPDLLALRDAYERFFHHILPGWISEVDTDHDYWPSSPSSNTPFKDANGQAVGDSHYWDVWHGRKPFSAYRQQFPRFMSEFGFQSLPPFPTIRTYAQPADYNMTSYIIEHHQKNYSGNAIMMTQMADTFRLPKDFAAMVYMTMVLQAEGIRYGVEHWRRNMHRVSGTLYWQLNDCWPVASWASLDYFGHWKALHYAAKRFYAPVLLSIEDQGSRMAVHVSSDLTTPWQGEVHWRLAKLSGEVLVSGNAPVAVVPLSSQQVLAEEFTLSDEQTRQVVLIAELRQGEQRVALNVATFTPTKHLELADPQLETKISEAGGSLEITITAKSLARFVELALDGVDVIFSDNYLDLPAGWTAVVTCPKPRDWSLAQAEQALKVYSLFDSFS
jgi:beta-mannosidase